MIEVLTIVKIIYFRGGKMKRTKTTIMLAILMFLAVITVGIAAKAVLMKNELDNTKKEIGQQLLLEAEITFYIYEGEGCACKPIFGASIYAGGEPGESGFTDEDGRCVLTLETFSEYRVYIEAEDFHKVIFDFDVIDDQQFSFHMQEKEENSSTREAFIFNDLLRSIFEKIFLPNP
jgi:hypothetical protein